MNIEVLGLPCIKSDRTLMNAEKAATEFDAAVEVAWIDDIGTISAMGIVHMPAVLVNGKLKSAGRIPSIYEIESWIGKELEEDLVAQR